MIHVDVKRILPSDRNNLIYDFRVETSVDGGPWKAQYTFLAQWGVPDDDIKREAEECARIFVNGCRFAGAEVRATSCGYAL